MGKKIKCPYCGRETEADKRYCKLCGHEITVTKCCKKTCDRKRDDESDVFELYGYESFPVYFKMWYIYVVFYWGILYCFTGPIVAILLFINRLILIPEKQNAGTIVFFLHMGIVIALIVLVFLSGNGMIE